MSKASTHRYTIAIDINDENNNFATRWVVPIDKRHLGTQNKGRESQIIKFKVVRKSALPSIGKLRFDHDSYKEPIKIHGILIVDMVNDAKQWKCKLKVNPVIEALGRTVDDCMDSLHEVTKKCILSVAVSCASV